MSRYRVGLRTITRDNQQVDVIYAYGDDECFVSPDGEGRYWYDSIAEAEAEHGQLPIVFCEIDE